jgi:hypothetical protein
LLGSTGSNPVCGASKPSLRSLKLEGTKWAAPPFGDGILTYDRDSPS